MAYTRTMNGKVPQVLQELHFDETPTPGSLNPVTSGGVAKGVADAVSEVTLDPSEVALGNVHNLDEVASFAADATILVDSETNGPCAMPAEDLLELTAQNALGSIHSLSGTATDTDIVSSNYIAIDGSDGLKKLPCSLIAPMSEQERLDSIVNSGKFLLSNASVPNNDRLNERIKVDSNYLWIVVESSFMTSYRVYFADSTGVLPDKTNPYISSYTIGIPQVVNVPKGYDTMWLFGFGQTNTTGSTQVVKIFKYVEPLEIISQKNSVDLSGIEVKYIVKLPTSNFRLEERVKYDTSSVNFRLDLIGTGSYPYQYRVYFSDSTGINVDDISNINKYDFGKYYSIDIPAGYDTIWYFCGSYNTSGSEVDVIIGSWSEGTINRRVALLEENFDGLTPFKGKNIVCFGDSITAFSYNGMTYPDYLRNLSFANVTNAGIGGTRYSARGPQTPTPSTEGASYIALDICNLVHSWCNNDWSYVDPAVEWLKNNNIVDLTSKITALKAVSVDDVDIVTIMAGTNDFTGEVALGTSGTTDTSKVFGGINSIIQDILSANPNIKIFMFSPTIRWFNYSGVSTSDTDDFSDVAVKGGYTLKEFSAAIVGEIEKSHIPVCDMYNTLGWNKWNFDNYFLDTDGTHPYKGFENIANRFYAFLKAFNN